MNCWFIIEYNFKLEEEANLEDKEENDEWWRRMMKTVAKKIGGYLKIVYDIIKIEYNIRWYIILSI